MELSEGLKKVFLAGVGAVATTAEAAGELVDQLVSKGELTVQQGKVLNEELKHNIKEKVNEHVSVNIVKEYKDVKSAVQHMSREEREKLREMLDAAEKDAAGNDVAKDEAASPEDADASEAAETQETAETEDNTNAGA